MTGLEKWKRAMIKEIEEMNVDEAMNCIFEREENCVYCDIKKSYVNVKGYCEEDCTEGIKAYLESEVE